MAGSVEGLTTGGILAVDNVTAEAITDATPRDIAAFSANTASNRVTPDHSTNDLTLTEAGTYSFSGCISFSGTLSSTFKVRIYVDGVAVGTPTERKTGTGGDIGAAPICASLITCVAGAKVTVRHWSTDGGTVFTAKQISITAERKF